MSAKSTAFLLVLLAVGSGSANTTPANKELSGANNEWINPLFFLSHAKGWLPVHYFPWVNQTNPMASQMLDALMANLSLGSLRYPGGSIGNYWDWQNDKFSPTASNCSVHPGACEYNKLLAEAVDAMQGCSFSD
jgi:hypothetical protein